MNDHSLSHLTGSNIELLISCTDLADLDDFTKTDPMCVLFYKQFGQWKEVGRTEAIRNTLSPKFVEPFVLEFDPALQQCLMFSVYDIDSRSTDLKHHDYVGSVEVTFQELLDPSKTMCTVCRTLRVPGKPKARGIISITSEVIQESRDRVSLHVGGHKLCKRRKILQYTPDVYLEISRSINNVAFHPVYRTETVHKTRNPRWRPLEIGLQRLCNGDWDRQLEFSVWHHSGTGDYKMLGRKVTTFRELNILRRTGHYHEMCLVPRKKDNHKNSVKISSCGHLRFFNIRIDCQYSLIDFIRGGMLLHLTIAIDFTSNQYTEVMESLGAVITNCNREQKVAMLGFGASVDNSDKVSHCFPLTMDWDNIYVKGISSAIDIYKKTARRVRFSGPSRLKPVLAMAESIAIKEPTQNNQVYHVLLIVTDGIINDMDDVIERLISISHLPLTVVFVGVGPADFSLMELFNYHSTELLTHKKANRCSLRKHTHFVSFRRHCEQSVGADGQAREAFAVISSQITQYMRNRDIIPNKPTLTRTDSISRDTVFNPSTDPDPTSHKSIRRNTSNLSIYSSFIKRSSGISGPKCPTCGSSLEHEAPALVGVTSVG